LRADWADMGHRNQHYWKAAAATGQHIAIALCVMLLSFCALGANHSLAMVEVAEGMSRCVAGVSTEAVRSLQAVRDKGIKSVAVVLKNSYLFPDHEQEIGELAKGLGFTQVPVTLQMQGSYSCQYMVSLQHRCLLTRSMSPLL
jgi:Hydantoinase/oxoprolinase N-terminal region